MDTMMSQDRSLEDRTLSVHQEHEVLLKLEQAGLDSELAQKVIASQDNQLARDLVKVLEGTHEITLTDQTVDLSADLHPSWNDEVEEHRGEGVVSVECCGDKLFVDGRKVNLFLPDEQKDGPISANKLRDILADKPVLNANVLECLLEYPELIPESWKRYYVYFWGTIFRDHDGNRCVHYLRWERTEWERAWRWFDTDWYPEGPHTAVLAD